jgi:hypothetical protein
MKINHFSLLTSLIAGSALLLASGAAQAFSFKTNYSAALAGDDAWKGDIILDSVEFGDQTFTEFGLVESANIVSNDAWTGGNSGAASADYGDLATVGLKMEDVDNEGVVTALGNKYLSSIIDTEDSGNFAIDLFFDQAVDNLLFWERGKNSNLDVQALDSEGNLVGSLFNLGRTKYWDDAGYSLDTREIGYAQTVGSRGVSLDDLGVSSAVSGIRVFSRDNDEVRYYGPDWKVMGTAANTADVPEPSIMVGLVLAGGAIAASRRRQAC